MSMQEILDQTTNYMESIKLLRDYINEAIDAVSDIIKATSQLRDIDYDYQFEELRFYYNGKSLNARLFYIDNGIKKVCPQNPEVKLGEDGIVDLDQLYAIACSLKTFLKKVTEDILELMLANVGKLVEELQETAFLSSI